MEAVSWTHSLQMVMARYPDLCSFYCPWLLRGAEAGARARARATEKFGKDSAQVGSAVPGTGVVAVSGRSSVRNSFTMDPTTDDDAQSTYCVVPVESFST